jgi:hypothetical protein
MSKKREKGEYFALFQDYCPLGLVLNSYYHYPKKTNKKFCKLFVFQYLCLYIINFHQNAEPATSNNTQSTCLLAYGGGERGLWRGGMLRFGVTDATA